MAENLRSITLLRQRGQVHVSEGGKQKRIRGSGSQQGHVFVSLTTAPVAGWVRPTAERACLWVRRQPTRVSTGSPMLSRIEFGQSRSAHSETSCVSIGRAAGLLLAAVFLRRRGEHSVEGRLLSCQHGSEQGRVGEPHLRGVLEHEVAEQRLPCQVTADDRLQGDSVPRRETSVRDHR
jgi:hypothetical protein